MKTLLTALLIFISLTGFAQEQLQEDLPIDPSTNRITFTGVKEIEASKEEIYNRTKAWGATTFNSIKRVIEVDNKDGGQVIGKGNSIISVPKSVVGAFQLDYRIYFTFNIEMKDGKYRYNFNDIRLGMASSSDSAPAEDFLFGDLDQVKNKKAKQQAEETKEYVKKEIVDTLKGLEASLILSLNNKENW